MTTKPWDKATWAPETYAVAYLRAIRENKIIIRRNKWRPDPKISFENQKFEGYIGKGKFGSVIEVLNTETKERYALKLQFELAKFETRDMHPEYTLQPLFTPTTEATISSSQSVEKRSLRAKRNRETRTYLLSIRDGHPNICNLEAFVQYKPEHGSGHGQPALGLYFEYCDAGSVASMSAAFRDYNTMPPELFLWHTFYELASALAFLHNQHPDYNTKEAHKGRHPIIHDDLHRHNVFFKWGPDKEVGYPHVKVGDFGISYTEPQGGFVPDPEYEDPSWEDSEWPPLDIALKNEVAWAGIVVYELATGGKILQKPWKFSLEKRRENFADTDPIHGYLSQSLNDAIRSALTPEPEDRMMSGELYPKIKSEFEKRKDIMYRKLPDWAGEDTATHAFDQNRLKELDEGGLEIEIAAAEFDEEIEKIAAPHIEKYVSRNIIYDSEEYNAIVRKYHEAARRKLERMRKKEKEKDKEMEKETEKEKKKGKENNKEKEKEKEKGKGKEEKEKEKKGGTGDKGAEA